MQHSIYNYQNLSSNTTMEDYNIYKKDKVTQRDITGRFFFLGNHFNDSTDEKNYHFESFAVFNGSNFGV